MDNFKSTNYDKLENINRKTTQFRNVAMEYIWNAYREPIKNYAKNELIRRGMYQEAKNDLDSITSDIMITIFERGQDGKLKLNKTRKDGTKALFRNYIKSVIKFAILDKFNDKINDPNIPIESDDDNDEDNNKEILPPTEANVGPDDVDLDRAFIKLLCNHVGVGDRDWDILCRIKLKGESAVDVATEYGHDRGWIDTKISRLMTALKNAVKENSNIKALYNEIQGGREYEMSPELKNSPFYKTLDELKENI